MPKVQVNGQVVDFAKPPTDADIDEYVKANPAAKAVEAAASPNTPPPTGPGAAGGAMVGNTLGVLGPGPDANQTPLAGGAGSDALASMLPTNATGNLIAQEAPADIARQGVVGAVATAAPMLIPEAGGPLTVARVLRGAARTIVSGGAAALTNQALRPGGLDMSKPENVQSAVLTLATNALPQLATEFGQQLAFNGAQQRTLRDAIETPEERLARAQANQAFFQQELERAKVAERVQGIGEQSVADQTKALTEPLEAMPNQLAPKKMDLPVVGTTLQDMLKGPISEAQFQRKNFLYNEANEIGDRVAPKVNAAHLVEPAKVVLRELAAQDQQFGHIPDPNGDKLRKRLQDLVAAGTSDETTGVPLYTSSDAKSPTYVGAKAAKPLDLSYSQYDELRQLLQPYVTRYEARSPKRTPDQGTIDGFMSDIRTTMQDMESKYPALKRAAERADNFYVSSYKPVKDVAGLVGANPQPSMIAQALLADGAPDRLFHAVRTLPPEMANTIRAQAWTDAIDNARKPDGTLDPVKLTAWWGDLKNRQQLAVTGGQYKHAVNDIMRTLVDTTQRASELKANRRILDPKIADLATKLSQADNAIGTAQETVAKGTLGRVIQGTTTLASAGYAPYGLGMGVAHLINGDYAHALAEFGLGGAASTRVLSRMMSNPTTLKFMEKMSRLPPGSKFARKFGAQVVASVIHDSLDNQINGVDPSVTPAPITPETVAATGGVPPTGFAPVNAPVGSSIPAP